MRDLIFAVSLIIVISISSIFAHYVLDQMPSQVKQETIANNTIEAGKTTLTSAMDAGFIVVLVFLIIAIISLGTLLPTHPIFFIPFIFVIWLIVVFVSQVSNVWEEFEASATFSSTVSQFTYIPHVMNNLPFYTATLSILVAVVIYGVHRTRGREF